MEIDKCAKHIIKVLMDAGYEAYIVGGCVRNLMLKREVKDWDICTSALPDEITHILEKNGIKVIKTGVDYGIVYAMLSDRQTDKNEVTSHYKNKENICKIFEVSTFKKYTNGKAVIAGLQDDLLSRDFTINAMAYNPYIGLVDITGGLDDLKSKTIRCIGDAEQRLKADNVKILRAIRFESQLGFKMDDTTYYWVNKLASEINLANVEKLQSELFKILSGGYVEDSLLHNKQAIAEIIPELKDCIGFDQNSLDHTYDVYEHSVRSVGILAKQGFGTVELRLAALLHDMAKPLTAVEGSDGFTHYPNHAVIGALIAEKVLRRINCTDSTIEKVSAIIRYHGIQIGTKSGIKRMMNHVGVETLNDIFMMRHADILSQSYLNIQNKLVELQKMRGWMEEILTEKKPFSVSDLDISGIDLIEMGFKPGKLFGQILSDCMDKVMDAKISNTHEELVNYILNSYSSSYLLNKHEM